MTGVAISTRRVAYAIAGLVIAAAPAVAVLGGSLAGSASRVLACQETDTEDSFAVLFAAGRPDVSDQLTEAEVAEPGWNARPGDGEVHHGGHGGHA